MEFLLENWTEIGLAITASMAAFSAIAALTPTPKDDLLAKKLYKIIDVLALNVGKAKD